MAGSGGNSAKIILLALLANLGIAISKMLGAIITGSASLFAETIHSFVDCVNQIFLLIGNKSSMRPPSERHPLGYGRDAFFWSFVVAILLFSMGGLFAIYEGIHKLSEPEEMKSPLIGLMILLVGIVLEGYSFHACIKEVQRQNRFGSLWQWMRKTTASELLVIFTEDAAAIFGLVVAAIALVTAWATGEPRWDAMGSIAIGVVLVVVATILAVEIKSLLVGESPATDYRGFIEEALGTAMPGSRILELIALQTGASEVLISCKFEPGSTSSVKELIDGINVVEKKVTAAHPEVRWKFFEPDYDTKA